MPCESTVGSDEGHCRKRGNKALGKAYKCFSRNPAQVNDLNGVTSSTSA